jgi:HK97 family phage portal protein
MLAPADPLTATGYNGYRIYDVHGQAAVIPATVINSYSSLAIPAWFRAVNLLSSTLASLPRRVVKDGTEPDQPHYLDRLLRRQPNGYQTPTKFWRTFFLHAAHCGNGYAEITWTAGGPRAAGLHNRSPEEITPFRYDAGKGDGPQQFYLFSPYPGQRRVIKAADMLHVSALSYDGQAGIDPVELHSGTLQRAATLDKHVTRYLKNGTMIRGAIELPEGISADQEDKIVGTLKEHFYGADADRDVIVLSQGAKLNNATLSPQEGQIVQQGSMTTKQIAQVTGVPPQFLYEFGESKYNNSIEQMGQDLVRYTLRPWIIQTEEELGLKLLSDADLDDGYSVRLNPDALLRGSTKDQVDIVTTAVNAGVETANEGRGYLGLPPLPDGNKLKALGDTQPAGAEVLRPPEE